MYILLGVPFCLPLTESLQSGYRVVMLLKENCVDWEPPRSISNGLQHIIPSGSSDLYSS